MVGIQMIIEQPNEIPATAAPAPMEDHGINTSQTSQVGWIPVALAVIGVYLLYQYLQRGD